MRYGIVYFDLAKELEVSAIEFLYLGMIHGLSNKPKYDFWCVMSNDDFSEILGVSVRTIQNMTKSLSEKELVIKPDANSTKKRVSEAFADALFSMKEGDAKSARVQNLHTRGAESAHNSNKITTLDNDIDKSTNFSNLAGSVVNEEISIQEEQEILPSPVNPEKEEKEKSCAKKEKVALPFASDNFAELWGEWKAYKADEFKFQYKSTSSEKNALAKLLKLSGKSESKAIAIVCEAMANGWKGFFQLEEGKKQATSKNMHIAPASTKEPEEAEAEFVEDGWKVAKMS